MYPATFIYRRKAKMANAWKRGSGAVTGCCGRFKAFVSRGNILDLAIGIILGVAFGAIVKSLVCIH